VEFFIVEQRSVSPEKFITFWSRRYSYPNEYLYDENIGKELTEERVWKLFAWKNETGEAMAPKKRDLIEANYISKLAGLPTLSSIPDGRGYLKSLPGGAIWGIFWLHIINPKVFPIFDQNTYRSMAAITGLARPEIPTSNTSKIETYFEKYVPFQASLDHPDRRSVDKALFAYGQFLKAFPFTQLSN